MVGAEDVLGARLQELHIGIVDVRRVDRAVAGLCRLNKCKNDNSEQKHCDGNRKFVTEECSPDGLPVGIPGRGDVLGFHLVKGGKLKEALIDVFCIHLYDLPAFSLSEMRGSTLVRTMSPASTDSTETKENMNASATIMMLLY